MKRLLLIWGLLVGFNCIAQTKTVKTYYDPLTKIKIHEQWTALNAPPYKKHGLYREWNADGTLVNEKNYKNGQLDGVTKRYNFIPDPQDAYCYGKLVEESYFVNGKRHGTQKSFRCDNGKLTQNEYYEYVNDEAIKIITYHYNGVKKKEVQKTGPCKIWYDNGVLAESYANLNGKENGEYLEYYQSGKLKSKVTFKNGIQIGKSSIYDEAGKEIAGGEFNNDGSGSPVGKWTYLVDKNDELTSEPETAAYIYVTSFDEEGYQTDGDTIKYSLSGEKIAEGSFIIDKGSVMEDKQ